MKMAKLNGYHIYKIYGRLQDYQVGIPAKYMPASNIYVVYKRD